MGSQRPAPYDKDFYYIYHYSGRIIKRRRKGHGKIKTVDPDTTDRLYMKKDKKRFGNL